MLIGLCDASAISRYENNEKQPTAELLIACEIIFGCHYSEIFPATYNEIRDRVMRRGNEMYEDLDGVDDAITMAKRELLLRMPAHGPDTQRTGSP